MFTAHHECSKTGRDVKKLKWQCKQATEMRDMKLKISSRSKVKVSSKRYEAHCVGSCSRESMGITGFFQAGNAEEEELGGI